MSTSPAYYTYRPLSSEPGVFRLLRLKQGNGSRLEAELVHTTMDKEDGRYEAVSYTWGDPTIRDFIFIDGKPLGITYNLSLVLHDLRLQDSDRILWNDATCINQKDLVEQGHQVHHMGNVYRNASAVLFCIGRPTELTDVFIDTLNAFQREVSFCSSTERQQWLYSLEGQDASAERQLRPQWHEFVISFGERHHMLPHRLGMAFQSITNQTWFQRIWIVQEVFNARQGIVHCGRKHVDAAIFTLCGSFITPFASETVQPAARPVLELMSRDSQERASKRHHRTLHELIAAFASSEASNPYDKIYAVLGMAMDATTNTSIVPDYTLSLPEVMAKTIGHLCRSSEAIPEPPPIQNVQRFVDAIRNPGNLVLLLWAAKCGYLPYVQYMVELITSPVVIVLPSSIRKDIMCPEPLREAAASGHESIVKLMLTVERTRIDGGALFSAVSGGHTHIVTLLLDKVRFSIETESEALVYAAESGHQAIVDQLLLRGKSKAHGSRCEDLYSKALSDAAGNGHGAIVNALIQSGKARIDGALIPAVHSANIEVVKLLLAADSSGINITDDDDWTPLNIAADKGYTPIVEMLLANNKADVNLRNNRNGCTPLISAAKWGHEEIVKLLLQCAEVDLNVHDIRDGSAALSWAASQGYVTIVKMLFDTGKVDINATDSYKRTAYYMACTFEHKDVMQLFKDAGHDDVTGWDDIERGFPFYTMYPYYQGNRVVKHCVA